MDREQIVEKLRKALKLSILIIIKTRALEVFVGRVTSIENDRIMFSADGVSFHVFLDVIKTVDGITLYDL